MKDRERELEMELERMEWMFREALRHGSFYRKHRAGYADFWALVEKDISDAYPLCERYDGNAYILPMEER